MTIWRRAKYGFAVVLVVMMTLPVLHVSAAGSLYADWTLSGSVGNWSGTMTIPATGFPAATYTADSNTPQVAGGGSAFLGSDTPFGAVYGSSQNQPYLNMPAAPGQTPSTTTFTFDGPTPPGWGFALGDVDADMVTIQASGPGGPLSADQLGFQEAFNYCNSSPVPPTCGPGPHTDVPTWNAGTTSLVGNVLDTAGASGWFQPTVPVTSLTFVFTVQSGIPIYQIWMAAPTADVSGAVTVETSDGPPAPPGTTVELRTPDGTILETATVGADGSYAFLDVAVTLFDVVVIPPDGYEVVGTDTLPADTTVGDVSDVDFVLQQETPPTTPPPTTPPPSTPPPTTPPPSTPPPTTPPSATPPPSTVTPTTPPPSTVTPTSEGEVGPATTADETTVPPTASTPAPPSATPPGGSLPAAGSNTVSALIVAGVVTALGAVALIGLRLSSTKQ